KFCLPICFCSGVRFINVCYFDCSLPQRTQRSQRKTDERLGLNDRCPELRNLSSFISSLCALCSLWQRSQISLTKLCVSFTVEQSVREIIEAEPAARAGAGHHEEGGAFDALVYCGYRVGDPKWLRGDDAEQEYGAGQ